MLDVTFVTNLAFLTMRTWVKHVYFVKKANARWERGHATMVLREAYETSFSFDSRIANIQVYLSTRPRCFVRVTSEAKRVFRYCHEFHGEIKFWNLIAQE